MSERPVLEIKDLCVQFPTEDGLVCAVDGVSLEVYRGQTLGVVGESGSGKSVTWLTVLGLTGASNAIISGQVLFEGVNLLTLPKDEMRSVRGKKISMVFQDPMTSLHPFYRVGDQIAEAIQVHEKVSGKEADQRAVEMLDRVGIPQSKERARQFPHEFSGGMRQRAMIAMALCLNPDVLIADEPTTALDVTVQAQILDLMDRLREEFNAAIVMITHDLGVVAEHCNEIAVMYGGKVVEQGNADSIYYSSLQPYTWGLLKSISRLDDPPGTRLTPIKGLPPSLINVPAGCAFHPRCPHRFEACDQQVPALDLIEGSHAARCLLPLEDRRRIFEEEVASRR